MDVSSPAAGPSYYARSGASSTLGEGCSAQPEGARKGLASAKENYPFLAQLFAKEGRSPSQPTSAPAYITSFPKPARPGPSVLGPSTAGNSAASSSISSAATVRLAPIRPLFSQARRAGEGGDGLDMGAIMAREFHFSAAGSARRDAMFRTGGSSASSSDAEQEHEGSMDPPRHPSAA